MGPVFVIVIVSSSTIPTESEEKIIEEEEEPISGARDPTLLSIADSFLHEAKLPKKMVKNKYGMMELNTSVISA